VFAKDKGKAYVFLASLLGFRFCPRFKDWADKNIYKQSLDIVYSEIEPLFREEKTNRVRVINTSLIIEQWDNIVRLVASLKNRKVTASLLIQKMATYSRVGRLVKAIGEVGRIFQTLYILEYIENPQLRGEVRLHLTRHESKNSLARYLFFGEEGELRRRDYESQEACAAFSKADFTYKISISKKEAYETKKV